MSETLSCRNIAAYLITFVVDVETKMVFVKWSFSPYEDAGDQRTVSFANWVTNKIWVNVEFAFRNGRNLVFEVFRGVPCLPTRLKSLYFLMKKGCHMVFGKKNMM